MNNDTPDKTELQDSLNNMEAIIWGIAQNCQGNSQDLLHLLRKLENAHRRIRVELFEESLPDNRQALYHLLREIEDEGGWPYIERMRIKNFLVHLAQEINKEK